jgi:hypothetical protein
MAKRVRKAAGVLLGSAALVALPEAAQAIPEPEPNDDFPGAAATPGVTIEGGVSFNGGDPSDFFHYTGLTPGSFFDVFVQIDVAQTTSDILAGVFENPVSLLANKLLHPGDSFLFDNLVVPANGEVVVGLRHTAECCEGYQLRLDVASATVNQPAALALVSAGLVGLGLHVARRRRAA